MGLWSFLFKTPERVPVVVRHPVRRESPSVRLAGDGSYGLEVVGESFRQAALSAICKGKTEQGHEHECLARLVPEPTNEHDPNAVKVMIEGRHVAYLARDDAKRFLDQMRRLGFPGGSAICDALINGGWKRERGNGRADEGNFGVELDLTWPLKVEG